MTPAALPALLAGRRTDRGAFVLIEGPGRTATALRRLSLRRVTAVVAVHAPLPAAPDPQVRRRLVTAARQALWRALRRQRGLAPVVVADRAQLTLAACWLDGARPPAATADRLAALASPLETARWLRQAGG